MLLADKTGSFLSSKTASIPQYNNGHLLHNVVPCVVLNETILPTDIETYKETDIELTTRSYTQTCTVTQAPTKRQKP